MNPMRRRPAATSLLTLLWSGVAAAQVCTGRQPFTRATLHFSAGLAADRLAQLYAAELRGGHAGVFATVETGIKTWEITSLGGESGEIGVSVGVEVPRHRESRFGLCPIVTFNSIFGPEHVATGGSYNYAQKTYALGLSAGYVLKTKTWDFVPTGALMIGTTHPKLTAPGGSLTTYRDFCCGRQTVTTFSLGLGLGFARWVTVLPSIVFPLGAAGETTYSARLVIALGKGV